MSTTENGTMQLPSPDKGQEKAVFEFRNGKIIFKQKPISFDKHSETLREIVAFRTMLEERIRKGESPLTTFPEEHKPLIAKLAHESDKTPAMLTRHIHHELLPTLDEEDENLVSAVALALPLSTVEEAIRATLTRNNYGVDAPLGVKIPNALCVWRWEVRVQHMDWLPKNCREKAEARLAERIQAREDIKVVLEALPEEERNAILDPKKTVNKLPAKQINRLDTTPTPETKAEETKLILESSKKQGRRREDAENDERDPSVAKAFSRARKAQESEKAAKDTERQEKKPMRLEKERKEKEAQNKSQSLMTKFFTKPKAYVNPGNPQEVSVPGPSSLQSDFERVFKPFALGKDKTLAPRNWFHDQRMRRRRASKLGSKIEVIVLDSEDERDVEMIERQPTEEELKAMTPLGRLQTSLTPLPPSASPSISQCHRNPFGFKIYNRDSVRDLMSQLSEAEISGNDDLVRELLAKLPNRDVFPAKALCFHTDARPGYFGTWTRSSKFIGPRRPFTKDTLVFDYAYDSGEEWEEEPIGEDVVDDGEEEDGDDEERDSDMDDWLVDDEAQDQAELSRASSPPSIVDTPVPVPSPPKRKVEDGERKSCKKRKVVIPLVPFAKGPLWESIIGQPKYEPFNSYTVRLFNDSPYPIDPFTFVSNCLEDYRAHQRNIPANNITSDGVFVVPALPPRVTSILTTSNAPVPLPQSSTGGTTQKKATAALKSPFPDAHIPVIINKINQLHASSLTALVEAIYLDLRDHKVTKVAIEAKIKEIGEKCRNKKVWVVKPNLMQQVSA